MVAPYENRGGLLVKPNTDQCAGYIMNFEGHGAYGPSKVETPQGNPTQAEIEIHNSILAKAEREAMVKNGRGVFYLIQNPKTTFVSQWTGEWKSPWCYVESKHSYGFCYCKARYVWFTGPDGKKWYGVNKGDMDCFTGRRLKNQR